LYNNIDDRAVLNCISAKTIFRIYWKMSKIADFFHATFNSQPLIRHSAVIRYNAAVHHVSWAFESAFEVRNIRLKTINASLTRIEKESPIGTRSRFVIALSRNGNAPCIIVRSARKYPRYVLRCSTRSSNGGADPFYREKWTGTIGSNAITIIWARRNRTAKLEWLSAASPTIAIVRRMPMQRFIACHNISHSMITRRVWENNNWRLSRN